MCPLLFVTLRSVILCAPWIRLPLLISELKDPYLATQSFGALACIPGVCCEVLCVALSVINIPLAVQFLSLSPGSRTQSVGHPLTQC